MILHSFTVEARFASRWGERVLRILLWPVRVVRARGMLVQLAALTDHELRDIGLSRGDLRAVGALPLDADPTPFLAVRVRERVVARKRMIQ